jgi:UDP-N-acetylmuramyl tripeptide synthase
VGRGGGTQVPGRIARRIDGGVLTKLVGDSGVPVVAITGSNGKTTTARFTAELLRGQGVSVSHNSLGSNLIHGVTSLAVSGANLRGRIAADALVAEVDEGTLLTILGDLRPRVLVVTELVRDQLDRFGELHALGDALAWVSKQMPPDGVLVANADDPLVASFSGERDGPRITFGFDLPGSLDKITRAADTIRCPRCRADLVYRAVYLSHLGDWACTSCGFTRPTPDVAVTSVQVVGLAETRCTIRLPGGVVHELVIPQAGVHIAYDAAAALAALVALGVPTTNAVAIFRAIQPAFGRVEQIALPDGRTVVLAFSKNPTSFNTTFRALASEGEPKHALMALSNTLVDGEDFAWLWDVDVESIVPLVEDVVVSGTRADELATRLKYAGVDTARMTLVEDRPAALDAALAHVPAGGRLVIVAGYTPTIELRDEMHRRGWTGRLWEQ